MYYRTKTYLAGDWTGDKSYRKGQRSAYAHMGNIGRRNSFFIYDNLKKDEAAAPPAAPPKPAAKKSTKGK